MNSLITELGIQGLHLIGRALEKLRCSDQPALYSKSHLVYMVIISFEFAFFDSIINIRKHCLIQIISIIYPRKIFYEIFFAHSFFFSHWRTVQICIQPRLEAILVYTYILSCGWEVWSRPPRDVFVQLRKILIMIVLGHPPEGPGQLEHILRRMKGPEVHMRHIMRHMIWYTYIMIAKARIKIESGFSNWWANSWFASRNRWANASISLSTLCASP